MPSTPNTTSRPMPIAANMNLAKCQPIMSTAPIMNSVTSVWNKM